MAQSENLASIEPWTFRPTIGDSWFVEAIARDTETLTKALQKSLSGAAPEPDSMSPFLNLIKPDTTSTPTPTPTVSGLSGSDQESAPKRHRSAAPSATGKVSKRKSRASKRSQTMFITADPANFRQMVQQVTGVRFGNSSQMPMAPILKPEPQRPGGGLLATAGGACLPTLDTSAFLLDHHQQQVVGPTSAAASAAAAAASGAGISGPGPLPFAPPVGVVDTALASASLDFDTFSSFPTLDSWKVM